MQALTTELEQEKLQNTKVASSGPEASNQLSSLEEEIARLKATEVALQNEVVRLKAAEAPPVADRRQCRVPTPPYAPSAPSAGNASVSSLNKDNDGGVGWDLDDSGWECDADGEEPDPPSGNNGAPLSPPEALRQSLEEARSEAASLHSRIKALSPAVSLNGSMGGGSSVGGGSSSGGGAELASGGGAALSGLPPSGRKEGARARPLAVTEIPIAHVDVSEVPSDASLRQRDPTPGSDPIPGSDPLPMNGDEEAELMGLVNRLNEDLAATRALMEVQAEQLRQLKQGNAFLGSGDVEELKGRVLSAQREAEVQTALANELREQLRELQSQQGGLTSAAVSSTEETSRSSLGGASPFGGGGFDLVSSVSGGGPYGSMGGSPGESSASHQQRKEELEEERRVLMLQVR